MLRRLGRPLLETDENDTLALWRSDARESGTWDEVVTIHEATELGSFEARMMMTRFPTYRLNASERESMEVLKRVPQMTA